MRPLAALAVVIAVLALAPPATAAEEPAPRPRPWAEIGLSDRQAAIVLLNRFTFGPRPGEVDEVVATGLWEWFDGQLAPGPDPVLDRLLAAVPVDGLDGHQVARRYRSLSQLQTEAVTAGVLAADGGTDPEAAKAAVRAFAAARGVLLHSALSDDIASHAMIRLVHGRYQLREVMTELWLDHLCVSLADPDVRPWLLDYQMTALRPRALGRFHELLRASARHPAMLFYLDGHDSSAAPGAPTTVAAHAAAAAREPAARAAAGPNENYARELLELHTLGVDGGYGERDVAEVARAFTGWAAAGPRATEYRDPDGAAGGFELRPDRHDAGPKRVLGRELAPGRGVEDGEEVLELLARHPATARHVCRRLALHFVSDDPPAALVDDLAEVWRATDGEVAAVLRAMVAHPRFWREVLRESKIKTPLQLQVSALRALSARVSQGGALGRWLERLGQPLHAPPTPAGWGDTAADWLDSGAVVLRQRFGFALAFGSVEGVEIESVRPPDEAAVLEVRLAAWAERLMPGRPSQPLADAILAHRGPFDAAHFTDLEREQRLVALLLASPEFQRR